MRLINMDLATMCQIKNIIKYVTWAEYKVLRFEVIGIRYTDGTGVGEEAW